MQIMESNSIDEQIMINKLKKSSTKDEVNEPR